MIKRTSATIALVGSACLATTAAAQSSAADRCTGESSTDKEAVECLRNALNAAERRLKEAGVALRSTTTAASGTKSTPNTQTEVNDQNRSSDEDLATLGVEQVAVRNEPETEAKENHRYRTNIVKFQERVPGRMRFQFENGQIWQQTAADAQRLRLQSGEPIAAELWSTWSGGYRMLLRDRRQIVRVERLR